MWGQTGCLRFVGRQNDSGASFPLNGPCLMYSTVNAGYTLPKIIMLRPGKLSQQWSHLCEFNHKSWRIGEVQEIKWQVEGPVVDVDIYVVHWKQGMTVDSSGSGQQQLVTAGFPAKAGCCEWRVNETGSRWNFFRIVSSSDMRVIGESGYFEVLGSMAGAASEDDTIVDVSHDKGKGCETQPDTTTLKRDASCGSWCDADVEVMDCLQK